LIFEGKKIPLEKKNFWGFLIKSANKKKKKKKKKIFRQRDFIKNTQIKIKFK
jgi:hypothetical protein